MPQLNFSFPKKNSISPEDFIASECNREALHIINLWPNWQSFAYILTGDEKSGKTHLANIWQQESGAEFFKKGQKWDEFKNKNIIIEDIDKNIYPEKDIFHLYNSAKEAGNFILFTASTNPASINFSTADLSSRINSLPVIKIQSPDDEMINLLLMKLFADNHIAFDNSAIEFVRKRLGRSYKNIFDFVEKVNKESFESGGKLNISRIKNFL